LTDEEDAMRGLKPPAVVLPAEVRGELAALARRHGTPQQRALRARIILAAASGLNNCQVARQEGVDVATVRLWRGRWLGLQPISLADLRVEDRLSDAPRPGRRPEITAEQQCRIVALACEAPSQSGRPISQWTGREIADELVRRGVVERISRRHAARLLKRGICSPIASATG
jgi:putative transposase